MKPHRWDFYSYEQEQQPLLSWFNDYELQPMQRNPFALKFSFVCDVSHSKTLTSAISCIKKI